MLYKMLTLGVALAALIALPAGSATAQLVLTPLPSAPEVSEPIEFVETPEMMAAKERKQYHHNDDGVAILKCREDHSQPFLQPKVFNFSATFETPPQCDSINDRCVDCLKVLTQKLDCEGNDEFTSNMVVDVISTNPTQQPITINKFVFECDLDNNDDDDDDDDD
jgi:hypothetical protein